MATVAVTKTLTREVQRHISLLLGRGREAFKCPLDDNELVTFWHNMNPTKAVEAYYLLNELKYDTMSMSTNTVFIATELDDKKYVVRLVLEDHKFLTAQRYGAKQYKRDAKTMANAMGEVNWGPFRDWMENCAIIDRDFIPALMTLEEVMGFCGTVGQLVRAIPDLYKYLPQEKWDLLRSQTRASNMPHEWHVFDRERVNNLQMCMAKASLLPKQDREFHEIKGTGAWYVE